MFYTLVERRFLNDPANFYQHPQGDEQCQFLCLANVD